MREFIERILNEYTSAKSETFANHQLGDYVRKAVPEILYSTGLIDKERYQIKGSVGQGNWASIPWIGIFDREITDTAKHGVYIVYLLSQDGNRLYLTLNQGCTDIDQSHSKSETVEIMRQVASMVQNKITPRGFNCDDGVDLGGIDKKYCLYYKKGAIFYKCYKKDDLPAENVLLDDLSTYLSKTAK